MGDMWSLMWTLLIIVGSIQLVAALALRFYTKTSPEMRLRRVRPSEAIDIVSDYVDGFEETRLGFPTGFFRSSGPPSGESVKFEELRSTSIGWKATVTVIRVPLTVGVAVGGFIGGIFDGNNDEGWARGIGVFTGGIVGVIVAIYLFPLVLGATVLEVMLKFLATSQIEATARQADDDPLDSVVAFKFRGATALLSERSILAGFAPPVLAPAFAGFAKSTALHQIPTT